MKNLSVKLTERFCNHSFKNSSLLGRRFNLMPNGTCCLWQFSVKLYHICRHTGKDFLKISESGQYQLATLVNNTKALAAKLSEKVDG